MTENNAAQEDILVRLNEIHADAGYLFGRAAADGSCAGAMAEAVRTKIDAVKALLSKLRAEGVQAGDERDKLEAEAFASTSGETAQFRHWWRKGFDTASQSRAAAFDASNVAGRLWDDATACDWPAFRARVVAALASAPVAVPENWKLVPIKPTPKMMEAWYDAFNANIKSAARSTVAYRALIDAAPDAIMASAPVAKPKRAPLDDWRVQAIAECLETEWDDMTPASAEADARLIVGYLIEYEKESDRIEAKHAAEPVEPIVQAIRNLRASAPVADERAALANAPVAGEAFKDECAATGQTCSYGPHGPHGQRQCKYCGATPQADKDGAQ